MRTKRNYPKSWNEVLNVKKSVLEWLDKKNKVDPSKTNIELMVMTWKLNNPSNEIDNEFTKYSLLPPFPVRWIILTFYIKVIQKPCINVGQWLIKLIHFNFDTKQFSSRIISVMQGEHDKGYKVWGYINHLHFLNNYTGWL